MSAVDHSSRDRAGQAGYLALAIATAAEQEIVAPGGPYRFRTFDFGERGASLSAGLIQEIGLALAASIKDNFGAVEAIVTPEPGGHMWGLLTAFNLGLGCYVLRAPSRHIPTSAAVVARSTAYSRGELLVPSICPKQRVLIVDDVVSSGGTLRAITGLLRDLDAGVVGAQVIVAKGQAWRALEQHSGLRIRCLQNIPG